MVHGVSVEVGTIVMPGLAVTVGEGAIAVGAVVAVMGGTVAVIGGAVGMVVTVGVGEGVLMRVGVAGTAVVVMKGVLEAVGVTIGVDVPVGWTGVGVGVGVVPVTHWIKVKVYFLPDVAPVLHDTSMNSVLNVFCTPITPSEAVSGPISP
jgi:hypothetical protein